MIRYIDAPVAGDDREHVAGGAPSVLTLRMMRLAAWDTGWPRRALTDSVAPSDAWS
jgi:hypothetical protein